MATNPFLQLYPGDYLAKTLHLTTIEHGAYLLLIMAAWGRKDCGLPDDDQFLARTVGLSTRKWKAIRPTIIEFWEVKDGYLYNVRLLKDRKALQKRSQTFSESGAKGAAVKKAKSLKSNNAGGGPASISDKPGSSILEPELYREVSSASGDAVLLTKRKRKLKGKALERFNEFWKIFAHKYGKREAADAWLDIGTIDDELFGLIMAGAEREAAARSGLIASGRSPKWAQGWINGKRWEDDSQKSRGADRLKWTAADWLKAYPPESSFAVDYVKRHFSAGEIPKEIRKKYGL